MSRTRFTFAVFAALTLTASVAQADTWLMSATGANDCPGVFGRSFNRCDVYSSPVIAKYDFPDDNGPDGGTWETNPFFPTVDGSEWSFEFDDFEGSSGSWLYTKGPGDPDILYYSFKWAREFQLWDNSSEPEQGAWDTGGQAISHIVFYNSGGDNLVAEPGLLALLGLGLVGIARRFRR